jgi:hypothetical protein
MTLNFSLKPWLGARIFSGYLPVRVMDSSIPQLWGRTWSKDSGIEEWKGIPFQFCSQIRPETCIFVA